MENYASQAYASPSSQSYSSSNSYGSQVSYGSPDIVIPGKKGRCPTGGRCTICTRLCMMN